MNLPFLSLLDKKTKSEYLLALLLRDEKVLAITIEQSRGKLSIINKQEEDFQSPLEELALDELVQILDTVLSKAEAQLPPKAELQNTVFGVKDTWVEEKKIKKEYLNKLKHLCETLELKPMGFIVLSEAISHLIQKEEGAPLSALITEIGKFSVTISLFRAGKLIEVKHAQLTDSPVKTVDEVLKTFELVEILPSRIILLHAEKETNQPHRDQLAQKFIAHQWSKSLPFLHVPQISILPIGFDSKAIVFGAATQLGYEFTGLPQDVSQNEIKTYEKHHPIPPEKVEHEIEDDQESTGVIEKPQHNKEDSNFDAELQATNNFGFIVGEDIGSIKTVPSESEIEEEEPDEKPKSHEFHKQYSDNLVPVEDDTDEIPDKKQKKGFALGAILIGMKQKIFKPSVPVTTNKKLLFIPPILLLLLLSLGLLYIFQLRAEVTLFVEPRVIDETQKITFSSSGENDFDQGIIASKEISISLDGSATTTATGSKEVGDKAKGTVTLYNSGNSKVTIKEGTAITSNNGLIFTIDKETAVASASGDIFTGIKSGTAQVTVTAKNIGTEYNLPSNTKFSLDNNSIAAKNDNAFSGGSKRKVTVVTKKDVDKLNEELPKSLEGKAQSEIQAKLAVNEVLLPKLSRIEYEEKETDKDVDDEAKEVKLTAKIKYTGLAYTEENINEYTKSIIKNKFANGQTFSDDSVTTKISGIKQQNESETEAILEINAGLLPLLDKSEIARQIKGKSYADVNSYTQTLPQVERIEIKLVPDLPFIPDMLPRQEENITIVTVPNE